MAPTSDMERSPTSASSASSGPASSPPSPTPGRATALDRSDRPDRRPGADRRLHPHPRRMSDERPTPDEQQLRLLDGIDGPRRPEGARRRPAPAPRPGGPRADHRRDRRDRRPLRRQPRHLRAGGGAAQPARLAARQDPVGRRPPGLPAQDPDRAPRPPGHDPPVRRPRAVLLDRSSPSTTSWAPATPRPRSATRSGSRRRCGKGIGEDGPGGRRDRRRRADRRGRLRGAAQRRWPRDADRDRPQRQRHVDLAERRRLSPDTSSGSGCNPRLYHAREDVEERLTKLPLGIGRRIERLGPEIKSAIKSYAAPGPPVRGARPGVRGVIDGHDVGALRGAIREALEAERPVVVHIHTVKGKGFAPAEEGGLEGMEKWHAAKPGSIMDRKPAARSRARSRRPTRRSRSPPRSSRSRRPRTRRSTPPCSPTRSPRRRDATGG